MATGERCTDRGGLSRRFPAHGPSWPAALSPNRYRYLIQQDLHTIFIRVKSRTHHQRFCPQMYAKPPMRFQGRAMEAALVTVLGNYVLVGLDCCSPREPPIKVSVHLRLPLTCSRDCLHKGQASGYDRHRLFTVPLSFVQSTQCWRASSFFKIILTRG